MYWAYMALIVSFMMVVVLHAWFVRRLGGYRDRLKAAREERSRLQVEVGELAGTVADLNRGRESNALSVTALTREIEELRDKARQFLAEHPELRDEFGREESAPAAGEAEAAASAAPPATNGATNAEGTGGVGAASTEAGRTGGGAR